MKDRDNDMWSRNEHACSPQLLVRITTVGCLLLFTSFCSVDGKHGDTTYDEINARDSSTNSKYTFIHVIFSLLNNTASRMTQTRDASVEPRTAPTETEVFLQSPEGDSGVKPVFSNPHDDTQHPSSAQYVIKSAESHFGQPVNIPRSTWWGGTRRKEERNAREKLVRGKGGLDLNLKEKGLFLFHSNGRKRQPNTAIDLIVKGDVSSGSIGNIKQGGEEKYRRRGNGFQYLEHVKLLEKRNIEFKVPSPSVSAEEEKTNSSDETYLEPSRVIDDVTKRDTFSGNINTAVIKSSQTPFEAGIHTGSSKMNSNDTFVKNGRIISSVSAEVSSPAFSINDRFRAIVTNVSFKQSHSVKNKIPPNTVMNGSINSSPGVNGWLNDGSPSTRQQSIQSSGVVRIDRNTATDNGKFPGVDTQIEVPNHSTSTQNETFNHREAEDNVIKQSGVHLSDKSSGSVSEMLDSPSSARIKHIGDVRSDLRKGLTEPISSDLQLNKLRARGEVSLTKGDHTTFTPQTISHPHVNDSNKVYNTELNVSPTTSRTPRTENVTNFNLSKNVGGLNETDIFYPVASNDMTKINSFTNQSGHLYSNFLEGIQAVSDALFGSSSDVTPMSGWSYRGEVRSGVTSDRDVASSSDWSHSSGLQVEATSEQHGELDDAGSGGGENVSEVSNVTGDVVPAWPVKLAAVMEGDLILGGLMMVHEREDSVTCGPIMPQGGIQALETMLYTLDTLNSDPRLLPNVTLGAHILDDCDKDTYGLEMAVDFIKGSISNIDGAEYNCNKTQIRKVISGVVGAASSVTSIQVANLLRLFKIPQVSFFSTSPELSNKQRFEYFFRTIPSDHYQVKVMVEIIRRFGWSYVSILYEESNYGIKAFEELETLLSKHNICIAVKEKLVKDSGVAEEVAYDTIVHKLLTKPRARGAIIFGSDQEVAEVMKAVRRSNATGSFSWIGSDGWSARSLVSNGNEPEVEGTLSVQPQANPVRGFEEYFLNLTVENNRRNPWFVEFWEDHFHCRYPNSSRTPYNQKYIRLCTTKERLSRSEMAFEGQLQFVSDAVLAFAHAFRDMHQDLCHGRPGLCDVMKPIKGTELLKYLRKVDFAGLSGDKFRFDLNGDGPARYNIIHFKQNTPGKYEWVRVGEYMEGELRLNMSEIQFKLGHRQLPESVCSLPCDQGQAKKYVEGESCCWHCFNCTQYQVRHPLDETQCVVCPQGTLPDDTRVRCQEIPEVFLRPESGWAIGAMSLSATGILVTLFVAGVFVRHNDTPVVRASGRELSYVLLTGILLCYCVTFALVLRPTDVVCGVQRFGAGFCFTVVYAALLTKTNRIARIFNAGKRTAKRPSFISPRSQLFICITFIGIQVLINGVWILVSPPRAVHHYPTRDDNHLVCSSHIDASYMIAFGYPIFLIVVCTVYAVLTRKIPEAFNESKHIGFTMYTTCVIWLAFVPLYFGTGNHVPLRITSMSVTISLSASVTLTCLFSPKLYIILVHPERNVRQSMMPMRYSAIKSPAVTGTTQTGSMMAAAVVCNQTRSYTIQQIHNASSQGVDSGTQSDGAKLDRQRKSEFSLVHQETQTEDCSEAQDLPQSSNSYSVDLQSKTCHIINSSSNGPMSIPASHKSQDVQL